MSVKNSDEVLAELEQVGAVGGPPKALITDATVTEVEIEQGLPNVRLRDVRGSRSVEALGGAVQGIDAAVAGLLQAREALSQLQEVWSPAEESEELVTVPEELLSVSEDQEAVEALEVEETQSEPVVSDAEALVRAREKARQKILGRDLSEEQRTTLEEEDNAPFVGQVRAMPFDKEPDEVTIGTLGTIKPSFPVES